MRGLPGFFNHGHLLKNQPLVLVRSSKRNEV